MSDNYDDFLEDDFEENKKPAEGGLVWMTYRNPKSKDKEVSRGIKLRVQPLNRKQLLCGTGGDKLELVWCVWAPEYRFHGGWMIEKFLSPLEETNEFGVVSP